MTSKSSASMPRPAVKRSRSCAAIREEKERTIRRGKTIPPLAHGCRSPVRATRSLMKASSLSWTRTSTAAPAQRWIVNSLASMRSIRNLRPAQLRSHIRGILPGGNSQTRIEMNRTDIAAIYIPDLIKVDLSTQGARLAGRRRLSRTLRSNPDDPGFSRLSIFGNDVLLALPGSSV